MAKGQVQAEAECFLLASNIALALKNHCCVLERVTTNVAHIEMDSNQARAIKLEIIFRDGAVSARFTISTTGTINDVLCELCITYKHGIKQSKDFKDPRSRVTVSLFVCLFVQQFKCCCCLFYIVLFIVCK